MGPFCVNLGLARATQPRLNGVLPLASTGGEKTDYRTRSVLTPFDLTGRGAGSILDLIPTRR